MLSTMVETKEHAEIIACYSQDLILRSSEQITQ